jgi:hypothetical protein
MSKHMGKPSGKSMTQRMTPPMTQPITQRHKPKAQIAPSLPRSDIPALADPDGFYEALLDAHAGLSHEESVAYNARLILILAHQVGRQEVLLQSLALAKA